MRKFILAFIIGLGLILLLFSADHQNCTEYVPIAGAYTETL